MTKENIRKVILAILFVLILVVIALFIGRFTYSYLGPAPTDELKGTGEVTPSGDTIIFSKGNDLSLSASTDNFHTGSGNLTDTTNPQVRLIASSDTNNASTTYYAGIRIYENTYTYSSGTTAELILSVYDENGTLLEASSDELSFVEVGGVKGFDITGLTGAYNIAIDHPISTTSSTNGTTHTWTFTLTFVNLDTDQSINETANLEMEVVLQKDAINMPNLADVCSSGENLATCIQTLYNTYGEGYGGLYLHDGVGTYVNADQEAGDNSYRFSGENPNNYVCFGSDAATCPSDNLYRIIGVFGNQVKLIKATYAPSSLLGTNGAYQSSYYYYWNNSTNNNTWSQSNLNTVNLNQNYLNNIGSTWSSKIATATWYVGGNTDANIRYYPNGTPKNAYRNEITSPAESTTYSAKIGLMYVSDYYYAASPTYWTYPGYTTSSYPDGNGNSGSSYDYRAAKSSNWMYTIVNEWTITRRSDYSDNAFVAYVAGYVNEHSVYNFSRGVRPSFYLNSSVNYVSGSGSSADPIRIT